VSTVLGRFVIPIYYVLGERISQRFGGGTQAASVGHEENEPGEENKPVHKKPDEG